MSTINTTIDFSKIPRRKQLNLLRAIGFDATEAIDEKKNPDRLLLQEIDMDSLDSDTLKEVCQQAFDAMYFDGREDFMRDNMSEADDLDIQDAYFANHGDEFDDDDEDCTEPDKLEDPQRCYLLAATLSAYARSRIRLTLPQAIDATKQMYQLMGWK